MDKLEQKHRKKLNKEQLEVLELLYKFRFGSNDLIAQYFGKKDRSFVFKRLSILLEQELIGKRFDSSYRIQGKPAAYYLTPAGARVLQGQRGPDKDIINTKSIYKDKVVKDGFVRHSLDIFAIYNRLKAQYGNKLKFFTRADLNYERFDYFPRPLPNAFISLKNGSQIKRFFLDIFDTATPAFALDRRIKQFINYYDSGMWDATDSNFPIILISCETTILQNRTEKRIATNLNNADVSDLIFGTTNQQTLNINSSAAWRLIDNSGQLYLLEEL